MELHTHAISQITQSAYYDATLSTFGKVDILINCAGKIKRTPTLTQPEEEWTDIVNTNLTGTLRGCQVFGKAMLERGYGRIINISSLTRSLAVEWSKKGVTVNAVAPGVFRTALNADLLDNSPRGKELLRARPWAVSARPKRWWEPSSIWPPMPLPSSPDRPSWSTAASRVSGVNQ